MTAAWRRGAHGAPTAAPVEHDAPIAEPIAIVGLSCRFPGAPDAAAFWELLSSGRDAVTEVPADRRAMLEGSGVARGGFVSDVGGFDAAFFGVSAREATEMDPQQRIMLELAWNALEDAGLAAPDVRPARTGVFVGCMWHDYLWHTLADPGAIDVHTATGADTSVIAARISQRLDLHGPSLTVNTACSSALVALHLACQSLRSGECALALAGGVSLLLSPHATIAMQRLGTLSPDARCKTFDANADGYVRSEGAGVVVLKRLGDALADGDPIYCVVRGSAVNHQGRGESLSAPSEQAQVELLHDAYAAAGLPVEAVHYVEAHGTGTRRGDPVEARALGRVLGRDRPAFRALRLGSVKSNIGHLEAASGMAGLIKVALSLERGWLPPSLNVETPNPEVDWDGLGLCVQRELQPWPFAAEPAVASVNSFGFGGTNAHVVLEGAQPTRRRLLSLAADTPDALRERLEMLLRAARACAVPGALETLCETAATHWPRGPLRFAAVAGDTNELAEALERALTSPSPPAQAQRRVVFVIPDGGRPWPHEPLRRLLLRSPAFRHAVRARAERELFGMLERTGLPSPDAETQSTLQLALCALWRDLGVEPDAVIGIGAGRLAATRFARQLGWGTLDCALGGGALVMQPGATHTVADVTEALVAIGAQQEAWALIEVSPQPGVSDQARQLIDGPCLLALEQAGDDAALQAMAILHRAGCSIRHSTRQGAAQRWRRLPPGARRELPLPPEHRTTSAAAPRTVVLSAATQSALRTQALRLSQFIHEHPEHDLAEVADAGARRAAFEHRVALTQSSRMQLCAGLEAFARGEQLAGGSATRASCGARRAGRGVVFVFSGHGSHWAGMGRELYAFEPAFRDEVERAAGALDAQGVPDAIAPLTGRRPLPERSDALQPLSFCVQVGLVALLRASGVEPAAVIGHSVGEIAAAYSAGTLGLDDAARVIARRAQALAPAIGHGRMLWLELPADAARAIADRHGAAVALAVHQSPRASVVSGDDGGLRAIERELLERDVICRWVAVDYASHGPQMEPCARSLELALQGLDVTESRVPMMSTTLGRWLAERECDAAYWARNLRQPVLFLEGIAALLEEGFDTFLEISPHPLLGHALRETASASGRELTVAECLRRAEPERQMLGEALGALFVGGLAIDWTRPLSNVAHRLRLPGYPFEHEHYWRSAAAQRSAHAKAPSQRQETHIASDPPDRPQVYDAAAGLPLVRKALVDALQQVLRGRASAIDFTQPLQALGLDSLTGLELRSQLEATLGVTLSGAALWRQPTLEQVTQLLWSRLEAADRSSAAE